MGSKYISDGIRFHCYGLKDARYPGAGLEEFMSHIGQDIDHLVSLDTLNFSTLVIILFYKWPNFSE
jgi:hypothetical protein